MFSSRLAVFIAICVACVLAAKNSTRVPHGPKPTHEPFENEMITFSYNGFTLNLYVKIFERGLLKCYIATLSDAEKMSVHSDDGLRAIELKYLGMVSGATMVDKTAVDASDVKGCGHAHGKNSTVEYYNV